MAAKIPEPILKDKIPVGYRFKPTDEELIFEYLKKKVFNLSLPPNNIMEFRCKDFYSKHPKHLVYNILEEREWFFFINLVGDFIDLSVRNVGKGLGFWKSGDLRIPIRDKGGVLQAHKALWVFLTTSDKDHPKKTHWQMIEYRMHHPPDKSKNSEWALVKIIRGTDYGGGTSS